MKKTRMQQHPIITGKLPLALRQQEEKSPTNLTGFYISTGGDKVFVSHYDNRVEIATAHRSFTYVSEDTFKSWKYMKDGRNDEFQECHVKIKTGISDDETVVAVVFSYYHAMLMYDAFYNMYRKNFVGEQNIRMSICISGWGDVRKRLVVAKRKGS